MENTNAAAVILGSIQYFRRPEKQTKIVKVFSSAKEADENSQLIFVGWRGRRKYIYFRRLPTKIRLF
jgi:hypothetical protein